MTMHRAFWLPSIVAFAMAPASLLAQDTAPALPKQGRIVTASVGGTGPDFIARLMAPKFSEGAEDQHDRREPAERERHRRRTVQRQSAG